MAQLAAAADVECDARRRECRAQLHHPRVDFDGVGQAEVGAHVRSGHDRADAVGHRAPRQVEAGVHVRRPVVDPGEQVEMQVHVCHAWRIGTAVTDAVTFL